MSQIILDMGSGNTCKNSIPYVEKMINAVVAIDGHKHEVIFKWQLFQDEPPNVPLDWFVFARAYKYAKDKGYKTTSSVFDRKSLDFLLTFDVPFVKIAARPTKYWLVEKIPRGIPVYLSYKDPKDLPKPGMVLDKLMFCVPKYPAAMEDYERSEYLFSFPDCFAISDHTEGLYLWKRYHPDIWEKHFILEDDPSNPDAAGHAIKPDLLKEVLSA